MYESECYIKKKYSLSVPTSDRVPPSDTFTIFSCSEGDAQILGASRAVQAQKNIL